MRLRCTVNASKAMACKVISLDGIAEDPEIKSLFRAMKIGHLVLCQNLFYIIP